MSMRALVVDDHPVVRAALVTSLVALGVFDEVDTANCFRLLVEALERNQAYRMLILDLSLGDTSGSSGVAYIREHFPDLRVLVFSANDSIETISECFEYGIHGFVSKATSMQVLVHAIRVVLAGSIYIPPAAAVLMGFTPPYSHEAFEPEEVQTQVEVNFTPRQYEVFQQLMQGVPNRVIAQRLDIAEGTVKTHLYSIYRLLQVNSRAQAILRAQQIQIGLDLPR